MPPRAAVRLWRPLAATILPREAESPTRLIDAGVNGLVVNTCGGNDEAIAAAAGRLPVVPLDRDVVDGGVDLVTSNNRKLVAGKQ